MKTTAVANSNIALVKYWGKRNSKLILPNNSSLSVTLDGFYTKTTVEFSDSYHQDEVLVDGISTIKTTKRVVKILDLIRDKANLSKYAKVVSENNFPTAAGLASSASGAAALAIAGAAAAGLNLEQRELSILARQGSGSASRSIDGGFVLWNKGSLEDGSDSFAEQVANPSHWPEFRILVVIVSDKEKSIKSRDGMKKTVETSPYYKGWMETIDNDLKTVHRAILERDFTTLGSVSEQNCLKMHATMITTTPPIIYWMPDSMKVIHEVHKLRAKDIEAYFTIDAGPNIKVICLEKDIDQIKESISKIDGVQKIMESKVGADAQLIEKHLF